MTGRAVSRTAPTTILNSSNYRSGTCSIIVYLGKSVPDLTALIRQQRFSAALHLQSDQIVQSIRLSRSYDCGPQPDEGKIKDMKLFFQTAFAAVLLVATYSGIHAQGAARQKADPAKDVRAAFDRLIEGIRQVDVEKVMGSYENSPRTLFFNNNGSITLGWETMKNNRESSYAKTKDVTLDVKGVRVEMLGSSAAYVSCTWTQSQVYDEKLENASGRMTLIFKKVGKDWKVVHLHTSPSSPQADRPVLESERTTPTDK